MTKGSRVSALAVACVTLFVACQRKQPVADDLTVEMTMTPGPPVVGVDTRAELTLRDGARHPVRGAKLNIEGHMSHPGMAPVIATVAEGADGVYHARLRFSMGGDWVLFVTGQLPDGRQIKHRVDVKTADPTG